jgi:hypothetical protein
MNLTRRVEVLESIAAAARAIDTTEPPWAAALFMDELNATQAYHAFGAVLEAIEAGRCFVLYPETPAARRLAVDFIQPGASQEVCTMLRDWLDYINLQWDKGIVEPDTKPDALAGYAAYIRVHRANMAFGGTIGDDDRAIVASDLPEDAPERMAIEARFVAWCNEMEIALEDQSNQSPAPAH